MTGSGWKDEARAGPAPSPRGARLTGDSNYALGALLVVVAVGAIAVSDVFAKLLSPRYPTLQIVFFRAVVAGTLLGGVAAWRLWGRRRRGVRRPWLQLVRGLLATAAVGLFFWGLAHAPFANAVAVSATAPLFMALLGWLALREPLRRAFWPSLVLGVCGVLFIAQPGHLEAEVSLSLGLPYLAVLGGALCYALVSVVTRVMAADDPAETTAFLTYAVTVAATGAVLAFGRWVAPESVDWPLFLGMGLAGAVGMVAYAQAYVFAGVANLAPWDNMVFPWALALSVLVFAETPAPTALIGGGLIMASGLLISWFR